MKKNKIIEIEREFSSPWVNVKIKKSKHRFVLGGKHDRRERLALVIAESGTALSYQPRAWANNTLYLAEKTQKKYALLTRSRIDYLCDVYRVDLDGRVETIALGVTRYRANRIATYYYDRRHLYTANVWNNYCANGYTTRGGLDRLIDREDINERCGKIALSHAMNTESGKDAHAARVALRSEIINF